MKWILIVILALVLQIFFPWWSAAIGAFFVSLFFIQKSGYAFLNGFLGVGLLWLSASLYISFANEGILVQRLTQLLFMPHSGLTYLITGFIGGITGGIAALSGNLLRKITGW